MANSTAYGFATIEDRFTELVENNIPIVQTAIELSVAEYQRQLDQMLDILVQRTTEYSIRYQLPGSSTLQPLDQHGNPLPVLPSGYYGVALPIQGGGTAWGDNRVSRALKTVADANRDMINVQNADLDWMARHILAAMFTNTTWTYDDPKHDTLTIQPLANGDTVTYVRRGGTSSTDNHYSFQAAAIADATNPYPTLYAELNEHPSNSGPYVAYIASSLRDTTMALATFVEVSDPDIRAGANTETIVGSLAQGFGDEVLGKVGHMWIVEWGRLPDGYIVAVAQGADPVVGMREYPVASLQGLFPEFQNVDGNRHLMKFIRFAGFGVMNRVGAAIRLVGAGAYAIPSGYTAPLAV
jgi:hypothetical protein